ncbi:unnamed protein product [Peronospora destructor]|uniref:Uncharacterized protein n=1 Tax=Peronospora destructor TaxID=86335 RepID=A0AAV0VD98_9STRA|nr:unnamed protein product [Peronospora destructor]CAI5747137.1 unnamed protein product [Peronospora destructor]
MKTTALLAALGVCLAVAEAGKTTTFADDVKPFPQPDKPKGTVLTAIEYKPSLNYDKNGCSSYPAVDEDGVTSKGLPKDSGCVILGSKSQVYARGCWHEKVWAQMYAWYIPVNGTSTWENVVLFLNNPDVNKQVILAVSYSSDDGYDSQKPPDPYVLEGLTAGKDTPDSQQRYMDKYFQPVITWELLTPKAQIALNDPSRFHGAQAPFNDVKFQHNIMMAWDATNL